MIYKMLCCVLGNSAMRNAISTSKIYEDELQNISHSINETSPKPEEFKLDFEKDLDKNTLKFENCWIMSHSSKSKNNFKGVLETEFVTNITDPTIKLFDISKDEKHFITGGKQNLKLWEFDRGKPIYSINTMKDVTKATFWDKKCSKIVSCAQSIILIDTETGNIINHLKGSFQTMTQTNDPNLILTATSEGSLK
jgi:hypothetical protein